MSQGLSDASLSRRVGTGLPEPKRHPDELHRSQTEPATGLPANRGKATRRKAVKILLAKEIGYCYGVEDAIDMAVLAAENANGRKVYTYGYIIHNPDTINLLQNKYGIQTIDNADEVTEQDAIVIIRTHGAKKAEIDRLKQRNIQVIDATCPFVIKTHRIVTSLQNDGYFVVVFGKSYHPEVIGILGQLNKEQIMCVQHKEDLEQIKWHLKIACVFQSTVTFDDFEWAIVPLARKCYELKIMKTVCEVTVTRQKYSHEVAKEADAMLVIGGKNSSNTHKLVDLCSKYTRTFHIEGRKELEGIDLSGAGVIGVTTGTSTPETVVEEIITYLKTRYNAVVEPSY